MHCTWLQSCCRAALFTWTGCIWWAVVPVKCNSRYNSYCSHKALRPQHVYNPGCCLGIIFHKFYLFLLNNFFFFYIRENKSPCDFFWWAVLFNETLGSKRPLMSHLSSNKSNAVQITGTQKWCFTCRFWIRKKKGRRVDACLSPSIVVRSVLHSCWIDSIWQPAVSLSYIHTLPVAKGGKVRGW